MTDFNDFVVAAGTAAGTVLVPGVVDGSTPTKKFTATSAAQELLDDADAAAMRTTLGVPAASAPALTGVGTYDSLQPNTLALGNQSGTYALPKTNDSVTITATGDIVLQAPGSGTAGKAQLITGEITASGADRTITPSSFTVVGLGGSFKILSGQKRRFQFYWDGATWYMLGDIPSALGFSSTVTADGTYPIGLVPVLMYGISVDARTVSGTCSIVVRKNGTAINGFGSAVAITSTKNTTATTESFAAGDYLDIVISSASSLTGLAININARRSN